nr:hypothetical protein [Candidatus Sigynarchaeum springense]
MKFFVDTFSWKKIDILQESGLVDIDSVYARVKICITHAVLGEIKHFQLKSCQVEKTEILPPRSNKIYEAALALQFDDADASMLSHGFDDDDTYIISEDRPLLTYGKIFGIKIVQLVDFMQVLTVLNAISKNSLYQVNKKLRELKNISKKKEDTVKEWLRTFKGTT